MKFNRLYELKNICKKNKEQRDCYFANLDQMLTEQNSSYSLLEDNLGRLDDSAWSFFRDELKPYLFKKDKKRGWTQLFDKFNEAKGYGYLLDKGCSSVEFIPPSRVKGVETPDLLGRKGEEVYLCEVKTINQSDIHRERVIERKTGSVDDQLNEGLREQLKAVTGKARKQLESYKCENVLSMIAYILIQNDDWQSEAKKMLYPQIKSYVTSLSEEKFKVHFFS